MWFRRKKPRLSREEALAAIPVRNPSVSSSRDDDGHVNLLLERQNNSRTRLLSVLFYVPKRKTIELDERGSFVWNLVDGETTVQSIIDRYRQRYTPDRRNWKEAELQVVEFLRMLAKKRLIAMAIVKPRAQEQDKPNAPQPRSTGKQSTSARRASAKRTA